MSLCACTCGRIRDGTEWIDSTTHHDCNGFPSECITRYQLGNQVDRQELTRHGKDKRSRQEINDGQDHGEDITPDWQTSLEHLDGGNRQCDHDEKETEVPVIGYFRVGLHQFKVDIGGLGFKVQHTPVDSRSVPQSRVDDECSGKRKGEGVDDSERGGNVDGRVKGIGGSVQGEIRVEDRENVIRGTEPVDRVRDADGEVASVPGLATSAQSADHLSS